MRFDLKGLMEDRNIKHITTIYEATGISRPTLIKCRDSGEMSQKTYLVIESVYDKDLPKVSEYLKDSE